MRVWTSSYAMKEMRRGQVSRLTVRSPAGDGERDWGRANGKISSLPGMIFSSTTLDDASAIVARHRFASSSSV
ncbi:hypothetical protein AGR7A_pAt30060 [Agrobacterium deltaense NCPPB 1641]|uniref:Uncharacterized protein n=1 Tax=Agrobacterium deltaense NCPPB 1641 TaxID=1183425 RepID=A0A1S7UB16_9HYPH|nr:hypothetical protein AGR7A_pAt30060 [Agrobacterium deltaense NCPPB 1641]